MLHVVHHPAYIAPAAPNSSFPFDKYGAVMEALAASGAALTVHAPEPMARAWIEAVHDPAYVDEVWRAAVPADKARRIGFPVTERLATRSRLTAGGTWAAARLALAHGYAANAAGGSHHALHDTGAGYCIFNDLAIAANRLLAEGTVRRILIVDLDVHQGDGTASLLAGRTDVLTLSAHGEKNFPARKARSGIDIALPDAIEDEAYMAAVEPAVGQAVAGFDPDLILYQAGVDVHRDDRLGRLALSDEGIAARDRMVMRAAGNRPVASALGGGYGADVAAVAGRHARTMLTLAEANRARGYGERA